MNVFSRSGGNSVSHFSTATVLQVQLISHCWFIKSAELQSCVCLFRYSSPVGGSIHLQLLQHTYTSHTYFLWLIHHVNAHAHYGNLTWVCPGWRVSPLLKGEIASSACDTSSHTLELLLFQEIQIYISENLATAWTYVSEYIFCFTLKLFSHSRILCRVLLVIAYVYSISCFLAHTHTHTEVD